MSSHQKLPLLILRALVATVALSACGQPTIPDAPVLAVPPPRTGPPRLARRDELTPAERAWGVAATRPAGVTYQPDVVLLEEGPTAIRAVSDNGLEDEFRVEHTLLRIEATPAPPTPSEYVGKAKRDGEDVLTPIVERIAEAVVTAVSARR